MTDTSIVALIRNITNAEEADVAFAVAATINLYIETTRRVHGRVLLEPNDVTNIFQMVDTMLGARATVGYVHTGRERKPNEEETAQVLAPQVERRR